MTRQLEPTSKINNFHVFEKIRTEFMAVLSGVYLQEQQIKLSITLITLSSIGETSFFFTPVSHFIEVMKRM